MSWFEVIILSIVQGVTEYLPVSSSGHLFLLEKFLGVEGDLLLFNIVVHFASLVAIVIVMWVDVVRIFRNVKVFVLIVVASIPAFAGGYLVKDYYDVISGSYLWIAIGLWVTSLFVFLIDKVRVGEKKKYDEITYIQALYIGLMQMIALMPGVSRSGSTILGGRVVGMDKGMAVTFAFLMALPVIAGATLLEMHEMFVVGELVNIDLPKMGLGFLICLIVSYVVAKWFIGSIKKIRLKYFALYTFILGLVVLVYYMGVV